MPPPFHYLKISIIISLVLSFVLVSNVFAQAATFFLSPSSGSYQVSSAFSVDLRINTSAGITSIKAYLNFSSSTISVVSLDTTNSVFSSWWENSFSNSTGRIQFQTSTSSPGFTGTSGLIAKINFQATNSGTASVTYDSSSLALQPNDVNILNLASSTGASFTITAAPPPPPADTAPPYTAGHSPAKGATGVAPNTNISLQVNDNGAGVNISTILMTVEVATVTPTITGTAASYTLTYDPAADFSYSQVVDVTIDARDLASPANVMTRDSYSFTIQSAPSPPPPPPPGCIDTGLGLPSISPSSPTANSGFTISCPANNNYDCLKSYTDGTQCSFSSWSGNNAVFNCSGISAGNYTGKCEAITGTSRNCCAFSQTKSFSVSAPPSPPPTPPPSPPPTGGGGGGEIPPTDTTPPSISNVKTKILSLTSVSITWATNEPATSQVEYGKTTKYGSLSILDSTLKTSHEVRLANLEPRTSYRFRVISKDASGNQAVSSDFGFGLLRGDFNSDGKVNIFDLSILLSNWKKANSLYDLNNDRIINISDLSILLSNWSR